MRTNVALGLLFALLCTRAAAQSPIPAESHEIAVRVEGNVIRRGTYRLPQGAILLDAVNAAGGVAGGDLGLVELSRLGVDGKRERRGHRIFVNQEIDGKSRPTVLRDGDIISVRFWYNDGYNM